MSSGFEAGMHMAGAVMPGAGAAAAAAEASRYAHQMLVGGLLIELPRDRFCEVAAALNELVLTGVVGWWRSKKRFYFVPYNHITFYCKTALDDEPLNIGEIEVPKIVTGSLAL